MTFQLHPRLRQDTLAIGETVSSLLLLMNDSQYPWLILVPKHHEVTEIYQLDPIDRQLLMTESCAVAECLVELYSPDKLNIAAIGNLVPQLHIHHVARYSNDPAWPAPIWGKLPALPYSEQQAAERLAALRACLAKRLTLD